MRCFVAFLFTMMACSVVSPNQNQSSLYQQLGSMAGLRSIVDELAWQLATDEMIASSLRDSDFMELKERLLFFLCAKTQGPCLDVGERPLVPFVGSPSGGAKRMLDLIYSSAQARGFSEQLTKGLVHALEDDIRAMIGPPRGEQVKTVSPFSGVVTEPF